MNLEIINLYISTLTELKSIIDNLDKEILFFNNLPTGSIYTCQEIAKLKTYIESQFQSFNQQSYKGIKGYEWFVSNHEAYDEEMDYHFSIVYSACCFLSHVIDILPSLVTQDVQNYFLNTDTPISVAYFPFHLLSGCIGIAIQMERIPCEFVVGLKWMSDLIVGKDIQNQNGMVFCSKNCLDCFKTKLPAFDSFVQQFLEIRVQPCFQQEQELYSDINDSILWHPCESNPHSVEDLTDEKWLVLIEKIIDMNQMGLILLVYPQVMIDCDIKDDNHIVSRLLNISGKIHISPNCSFSLMSEINTVAKKIVKTKENKTQLALLQKRLKNSESEEFHQVLREQLVEKLSFWIDNINRDKGVTKPYLFVILALYSLAVRELDYALCNAVSSSWKVLKSVEVLNLATNKDDSIPRLLMSMVTLRRLLLQYEEELNSFVNQLYDVYSKKWSLKECGEFEWLKSVSEGNIHQKHLFSMLQYFKNQPSVWLLRMTEIRVISFYYELMLDFCKKHYKDDIDIQFLFIDVHDMILSSPQHYPSSIYDCMRRETVQFIEQMKQTILAIVHSLWEQSLSIQELNQNDYEQLQKYVVLIRHYPVISYDSETYDLVNILEDTIITFFIQSINQLIDTHKPSIEDILTYCSTFNAALQIIAPSIPGLSVTRITDSCRRAWNDSTIPLYDYLVSLFESTRSLLLSPSAGYDTIQHHFVDQGHVLTLLTEETIHKIIALLGFQSLSSYTHSLQDSMKQSFITVIHEIAECMTKMTNRDDFSTSYRSNSSAILSIINHLKELGRDDFIHSQIITGVNGYFKEMNWTVDQVLSSLETTPFMKEITSLFGITKMDPISVTSISTIIKNAMFKWREEIEDDFDLTDLSYLLFCVFNMNPSYDNMAELLHGCRILCHYLSPVPSAFSDLLQDLFQLFCSKRKNKELITFGSHIQRIGVVCPIRMPVFSLDEINTNEFESVTEMDSDSD